MAIADDGARISSVTEKEIRYQDKNRRPVITDLEECNRFWIARQERGIEKSAIRRLDGLEATITEWDRMVVGARDMAAKTPWVQFFDEQRATFVFCSSEAASELLLAPLQEHGRTTFDTT